MFLLVAIECVQRFRLSEHRLDLHGDPPSVEDHHEIQLTVFDPQIVSFDHCAAGDEKAACNRFAEPADTSRTQICIDGSSSSMFTSRKLRTWTFFRKRAGRYMSHTHASLRVSSK